jgi:uncharacterized damage-inducible protein DinB
MPDSLETRFRRWFDYEQDAHAKVIQSLESVPPNRRSAPEFVRAVGLLAHIVAARRVWLGRLGAAPPASGSLFPQNMELDQVIAQWNEAARLWTDFLGHLTDEAIARPFEYQSLDAGRFRNRLEDVLTQLFGHSWYHRGQIAMLVRAAGGEPAITDFIYWCRESI